MPGPVGEEVLEEGLIAEWGIRLLWDLSLILFYFKCPERECVYLSERL